MQNLTPHQTKKQHDIFTQSTMELKHNPEIKQESVNVFKVRLRRQGLGRKFQTVTLHCTCATCSKYGSRCKHIKEVVRYLTEPLPSE